MPWPTLGRISQWAPKKVTHRPGNTERESVYTLTWTTIGSWLFVNLKFSTCVVHFKQRHVAKTKRTNRAILGQWIGRCCSVDGSLTVHCPLDSFFSKLFYWFLCSALCLFCSHVHWNIRKLSESLETFFENVLWNALWNAPWKHSFETPFQGICVKRLPFNIEHQALTFDTLKHLKRWNVETFEHVEHWTLLLRILKVLNYIYILRFAHLTWARTFVSWLKNGCKCKCISEQTYERIYIALFTPVGCDI